VRDAYTHAYCDRDSNSNSHADSDTYTYCNTNSHSNGDSYAYGDADTDDDANPDSGNADGDAYVPAGRHTRAVEHGCTVTECSVSRWWNHRWNLLLRLRWPNLHRQLP
jgi:hypothetical protein